MSNRLATPVLALAIVPVLVTLAVAARQGRAGPGPATRQSRAAVVPARPGPAAPLPRAVAVAARPGPAVREPTSVAVAARPGPAAERGTSSAAADPQVVLGRYLVLSHACGGCHGGGDDPSRSGWLAGDTSAVGFLIGECTVAKPDAKPCFNTHPRNLTPDVETGLGRFTARQIFNALRYGLRPEATPDVKITSTTPGKGNFPLHPHYLAPPMPWPEWRHMRDQELWAIAAYLKRGLKPVRQKIAESEGPPDFWAGLYAGELPSVPKIGPYPVAPFPTANETGGPAAVTAESH